MAVDIMVNGEVYMNAHGYTVTEDSTPVDIDDFSGGVGEITYTYDSKPEDFGMRNKPLRLTDGSQGVVSGTIKSITKDDMSSTFSAYAQTIAMSVSRTMQPYRGTLEGAIRYYLSMVDLPAGDILIDESIRNRPVVYPGWTDEVYLRVAKHLCAAQQIEMSYVSEKIVFRPLRGRVAERYRDGTLSTSIDESSLAQKVRLNYYNPVWRDRGLAYPAGGWNEDVEILSVGAGETVVFDDIEISSSLASIEQPECVLFVGPTDDNRSVYTVSGSDGLPIPPRQWADQGGSLTVAINEDTRSLKVTIRGAEEKEYAPYSIAVSSGPSNDYSTLRILGSGVFMDKQTIEVETGYGPDQATTEIAGDSENEFVGTFEQAQKHLLKALNRFGSPTMSINVTTGGINRVGDTGSYAFATIGQFNQRYAGMTMAAFNAQWAGKSIRDFNAFMRSTVSSRFENQAFGNIAGSRTRENNKFYRVRTVTNNEGDISYSGDEDTVIGDVNTEWKGKTIKDFNKVWAYKTIADYNVRPLWNGAN